MNPEMAGGASDSEEESTKAHSLDGLRKDRQREGVSREQEAGAGMQWGEECEEEGKGKMKMKRRKSREV